MKRFLTCLSVFLLLFVGSNSWAHKASDSFLYLDQTGDSDSLRVDVALRDLALVLPLDANGDQQLSGAEVRAARDRIAAYVEEGISVGSPAGECGLTLNKWGISEHSDGPYAAGRYDLQCPDGAAASTLRYNLLFEEDPLHRGLVQHRTPSGEGLAVLAPENRVFKLSDGPPSMLATFTGFVWQGVVHLIWGFDHVLFLLVLILPATMVRAASGRRESGTPSVGARNRFAAQLLELAGIVTAFTVAHSVTLGLSALELIKPPIAWIEIIIALSIALAALNLFWPVLGRKTWKLAFGFGLIHGFGFASVLGDLTSGVSQKALALAGFNLGVELGQLALLIVLFPILFWVGRHRVHQQVVVPLLALGISGISLYWVVERVASL